MEKINEGKTPILQLFKEDNFDMVRCPICGSDSGVHHYRVEIFEREQDAPFGLHVTVQDGKMTQDRNITNNPSSRRGGLSVFFWCECCDEVFVLNIAQHKGHTEVSIRRLSEQDIGDLRR